MRLQASQQRAAGSGQMQARARLRSALEGRARVVVSEERAALGSIEPSRTLQSYLLGSKFTDQNNTN